MFPPVCNRGCRICAQAHPDSGALREQRLRLDGVNQRECEQIALTGESRKPALESFFTHVPVGVCRDQISLPDHVELSRGCFHLPKRNARYNLFVQIVLPVANLRLKLVEQLLLGVRQTGAAGRVASRRARSDTPPAPVLLQVRAQPLFGNGENFGIEKCSLGVYVGFKRLIRFARGIFAIQRAAQMQVAFVFAEKVLNGVMLP